MSIISTDISKAKQLLENEELVAIPTETVYGLAGNIYSEKAIVAIFETKKRPFFNPLIVHISSKEYLKNIAQAIPAKAKLLANSFWPGPLTLVLPKKDTIPDLITAGKATVAVRVPNHPSTLKLLNQLTFPLAAPSANPFNRISPTKPEHVEAYFKDNIKMVLDGGDCKNGIESTIIGFENDEPIIYRLGSTPIEAIETVVGEIKIKNKTSDKSIDKPESSPNAPGMLLKHYAPRTKTILSKDIQNTLKYFSGKRIGIISFFSAYTDEDVVVQKQLSKKKSLEEAASNLYDALHELDSKNLDVIITEKFPNEGLGKSINDRLKRATAE